jgi:SAM-dependent methyltransferase
MCNGFDLVWVDGSVTPEGKALPQSIKLRNCQIVEVHSDVKGGPDNAIRLGLKRLLHLGYQYCGLIENDVAFEPCWFPKLVELFKLAEEDGLSVGATTVRTINSRVLLYRSQYAILWNTGAGMVLFTREAARIILAAYKAENANSLARFYMDRFGVDLAPIWELRMDKSNRELGCDWAYSMHLYKHGLVSLGSIPSMAFNVDFDPEKALRTSYVTDAATVSKANDQTFLRFRREVSPGGIAPKAKKKISLIRDSLASKVFWAERQNRYFRGMAHPVSSAKSLYCRAHSYIYQRHARRKFRSIRRTQRDRCWCGGELLPFEWHPRYAICAHCGCYVNRCPPLPEELKRLYSFGLYWHTRARLKGHPTIERRPLTDRSDGRLDYWLSLIDRYSPSPGRVVEVGCAHGVLLSELKVRGYECIGVEPDERTADWTKQNAGLDVRPGFFPGIDLPHCNLFLAFDVIEHSPNPLAFMSKIAQLLKPAGIAIIQTPIDRYTFQPPFGERFSDAFDDIEHLYLFTNKAMKELADRVRLEIINGDERLWLHHEICIFKKA